jgi:hypothetical protein
MAYLGGLRLLAKIDRKSVEVGLVSEDTFALAQEQLQKNKHHSPRRTIEPTLLQGMLVCQNCGYALYRTSTDFDTLIWPTLII